MAGEWPENAVVRDPQTHAKIATLWRETFPYRGTKAFKAYDLLDPKEVIEAAKEIYRKAGVPEIVDEVNLP